MGGVRQAPALVWSPETAQHKDEAVARQAVGLVALQGEGDIQPSVRDPGPRRAIAGLGATALMLGATALVL